MVSIKDTVTHLHPKWCAHSILALDVGLCQTVVTVKWNYCASFCVVVTVIGIVSVTEGTELLELSSFSFIAIYAALFHDQKLRFLAI